MTIVVVDRQNTAYALDKKLGEGGQGRVYSVKGGKLAVKLINRQSKVMGDRLSRQLTKVKTLFEIKNLPIAMPLEMLQPPHLGYVMELLTGMTPISKLMRVPKKVECLPTWYLEGGGLRRRLILLAKSAEALSQIHGKGLVYADPSPNNIFVSSDVDAHEIRFIDADNLCHESDVSPSFYTPGYGAPELVKATSGVNTLTDAYAFAVIVFQTLTTLHPLTDGDLVSDGEPELEEKALRGEIPWIYNPDDNSNFTERGFNQNITLSPRLQTLAKECFGEGLLNPQKRPGVGKWAEFLYNASDYTITCPHCESTYYANQNRCPWCDHPQPDFVRIKIYRWHPYEKYEHQKPLHIMALERDKIGILTSRIITGRLGIGAHQPNLEIEFTDNFLRVHKCNNQQFLLTSKKQDNNKLEKEITEKWQRFPVDAGRYGDWLLHFGSLNHPHRYASFSLIPSYS
ncbi:serine/threonine protein kinase [Cyanobacterium stanieri PCC 7202]|uniref:Serine/threonine protein kinase n=1 Tax=Cyanobacterium stanieri (strain ATCC 29140 / PCC 7202) TaxID=292563 RepID=K9YKQ7_CYASC|nr:serine/threonine protein kinase [Cyanobacterium stanieri PCC 7202]